MRWGVEFPKKTMREGSFHPTGALSSCTGSFARCHPLSRGLNPKGGGRMLRVQFPECPAKLGEPE